MVGPIDVKHKGNESTGCYVDQGTFGLDLWPWALIFEFSRSNCISGMVGPDRHGKKGMGVDRMPWCETRRKWVNRTLRWLGYFWPLPLTLDFQVQIVSREWDVKDNHYVTSRQRKLLGTGDCGDLRCRRFHSLILVLVVCDWHSMVPPGLNYTHINLFYQLKMKLLLFP